MKLYGRHIVQLHFRLHFSAFNITMVKDKRYLELDLSEKVNRQGRSYMKNTIMVFEDDLKVMIMEDVIMLEEANKN